MEDDYCHPPYDCNDEKNEKRPRNAIYQPEFIELKKLIREVTDLLCQPLLQTDYRNAITNALLTDAQKRTRETTSEETLYAVSGDMNSGKSSVINSILSIGTIARKVHFFTAEETHEIIASLLHKYWHASGKGSDDSETSSDGENKSENYNDMTAVLDSFLALFCNHAEFENQAAGRRYLDAMTSEKDEDMISTLADWAQDVVADNLQGEPVVTVEAPEPAQLLFALQPYTYSLEEDGFLTVAPWPLVSVIDFTFDHPLLNEGISFVDAPGITDANFTRAQNAIKYGRQCTHKITVADIARAKDDKSLRESLAAGYRLRGAGHSILVITKGDSINSDTEVFGPEKAREMRLKDEVNKLRSQRTELNKKRAKAKREDRYDIDEEMEAVSKELHKTQSNYESLRMGMRNRSVLKKIRQQFTELTGEQRLPAFVVGNEDCKRHQAGYQADEAPTMTPEETGIPALRSCIYALPASAKLADVLHIAESQLPNLINSFELFCQKTHMDRKSEIEAMVLKPKDEMGSIMKQVLEEMKKKLDSTILCEMKELEPTWTLESCKFCVMATKTHARDALGLMKKHGLRKGTKKTGGDVDWNASLMKINQEELNEAFRDFSSALKLISRDRQSNLMALENFAQSFTDERPNAIRAINEAERKMNARLTNIQEDAVMPSPTAYLPLLMRPIYDKVHPMRGPGAPQRRAEAFIKAVSGTSGVWMDVHDKIEYAMYDEFGNSLVELEATLGSIFDAIHTKFTILCDNTVAKSEEDRQQEEELRQKLGKNLALVQQLMEGPVKQAVEACKKFSKEEEAASSTGF
ncbi:hypothetical protein KC345_g2620 [Hortaea werneckii]|nr:hypothetical protein KC345_g2620 [Hortaea werneckii]